jgi:hypothetical protein
LLCKKKKLGIGNRMKNLAESSKEGSGSKMAVFPMMKMEVM